MIARAAVPAASVTNGPWSRVGSSFPAFASSRAGAAPAATQIALNISSACGPPRHSVVGWDRAAWQACSQLAGLASIRSGRATATWAAASSGSAHGRPSST